MSGLKHQSSVILKMTLTIHIVKLKYIYIYYIEGQLNWQDKNLNAVYYSVSVLSKYVNI